MKKAFFICYIFFDKKAKYFLTRVITVSVAQGGTATPGTTKQLLPPENQAISSGNVESIIILIYSTS